MTRLSNKLFAIATIACTMTFAAASVEAGCSGGRSYGGYGNAGYGHGGYGQRGHVGGRYDYGYEPRAPRCDRPVDYPSQPYGLVAQPQQQPIGQPGVAPQFGGQQPIANPGFANQPFGQQVNPQRGLAPGQLGGVQQPVVQPRQQQVLPTQPGVSAPIQQPAAPQTAGPQTNGPQGSALDAALQALGGVAPAQPQTQQTVQEPVAPAHVGNFTARLNNGAVVRLSLGNNGQFSWVATNKNGKTTEFGGAYEIGSDALVLTRSNDNQKLNGNLSGFSSNGFRFQLSGTTAALSFVRG